MKQRLFDDLKGIATKVQYFEDKNLIEVRKKLYDLIKELENGDFIRKDEGKVVRLWYCSNYSIFDGSDISISVGDNGLINVCTDGLWGTLNGIYETINEQ